MSINSSLVENNKRISEENKGLIAENTEFRCELEKQENELETYLETAQGLETKIKELNSSKEMIIKDL